MNSETIVGFLNENGLKPATKRDLSLLLFSLIAEGYSNDLKQWLGFAYERMAAIGDKDSFCSLLNEEEVAYQTQVLLSKQNDLEKDLLNPILNKVEKIKTDLDRAESASNENPWNSLEFIVRMFPEYMSCLGVYNCFMRLTGDGTGPNNFEREVLDLISKQRNSVAILYPRFEKLLSKIFEVLSRIENKDLTPLRMMTCSEARELLTQRSFEKVDFEELKQREKGYYYQFQINQAELVIINPDILSKVRESIFHHEETNEIFGKSAFGGIFKGKIRHKNQKGYIEPGEVLVCGMTHPDDIQVLKKCGAIITDEGGILSHAAIIARELKKPCIIGTKIATKVLHDGDEVEVDAEKGIVRIIKRA